MKLKQSHLAAELGVSEMSISRWVRALGREGRMTESDALLLLMVAELMTLGFASTVAVETLCEFQCEARYVAGRGRPVWLTFFTAKGGEARMAALSERHLSSIVAAFGLCAVIDLREVADRARERLERLKTSINNQKEAA
ncbi:hypothetical protein [Rhizobium sp. FKL33]|uniref:hypothetical protein n=1 Tax=Rhizobium sp. FKL33 TaxID=2562307 RepID=UPI0010C0E133|nr:hypothetical protein [Rhizobium sp. FKL33]